MSIEALRERRIVSVRPHTPSELLLCPIPSPGSTLVGFTCIPVNGRYALAATAEERMAIAVVAALHSYFVQHPKGVAPCQGFLAEYLKPFLERELLEARLDELHKLWHFRERERELLDSRRCKMRECVERIQHREPL